MADTLSTMRMRVSDIINRPDVTDARITGWINDAQRLICRRHNFEFMKTSITASTVDKQQKYLLPNGTTSGILRYKQDVACELINNVSTRIWLTRRTKRDLEADPIFDKLPNVSLDVGYGTPSHYCCWNGYLYLFDAPDHALNESTAWTISLDYFGYLDDLSANSDTNGLVGNHPELLERVAASIGFEKFCHEFDKSNQFMMMAVQMMDDMVKADMAEQYATLEEGFVPTEGNGIWNDRE